MVVNKNKGNDMRLFLGIFSIFVLSILLQGCVMVEYWVICNNTNKPVIFHFYAKKDSPLKEPKEAVFTIENKKAIRISAPWSWYVDKLEVRIGNDMYIYNCKDLPWPENPDYIASTWSSFYIFFQFDADGKIYLLKPDNLPTSEIDISDKESKSYPFPSAKIPEQPEGYPLVPVGKYKIISN